MSAHRLITFAFLSLLAALGLPAFAQNPAAAKEASPIQDNSFLIEEAYNQERGVVQHINTFSRLWNSRDWNYSFTQEWPGRNQHHQFSYTLVGLHSGALSSTGAGWGDTAIHYRYQWMGNGESRLAIAPRLSLLLPTGDVTSGRGMGSLGLQSNLPVSIVLHRRLVSHWNAGITYLPRAQDNDHCRAVSAGYNLGQSFVLLVNPRLNLLLETSHTRFQSVVATARTEWSGTTYFSPGVRWAYNLVSGLQIVPGVAFPIGIASSTGERGVFLYLSLEHPFRKL